MAMGSVLDRIAKMEVQSQDVFVAGFPRSGTTWLQQVVYMLYNPDNAAGSQKRIDRELLFRRRV